MSIVRDYQSGYIRSIAREEYDAIEAINQSAMKRRLGDGTWAEVAHAMANSREPTKSQQIGTSVHMTLLESIKAKDTIVRCPDREWTRATKAWKEWVSTLPAGSIPLRYYEYDDVMGAVHAVRNHPVAGQLIEAAEATEVTAVWQCPYTKLECKALIDVIGEWGVADLKTSDPKPSSFLGQVLSDSNRLAFQAAWYTWGLSVLTGEEMPYAWIAVSDKAPHLVAVYDSSDVAEEIQRYRETIPVLMRGYSECEFSGDWPGLPLGGKLPYRAKGGE